MDPRETNLAYPYDIEGEIRYKSRVFVVAVRETQCNGLWDIYVFEFINGTKTDVDHLIFDSLMTMHEAFGLGISRVQQEARN